MLFRHWFGCLVFYQGTGCPYVVPGKLKSFLSSLELARATGYIHPCCVRRGRCTRTHSAKYSFELCGLVEGVPCHGRGLELDGL